MLTLIEKIRIAKEAGEGPKLEIFSEMCAYIENKWGFPDCECITPAGCNCGQQSQPVVGSAQEPITAWCSSCDAMHKSVRPACPTCGDWLIFSASKDEFEFSDSGFKIEGIGTADCEQCSGKAKWAHASGTYLCTECYGKPEPQQSQPVIEPQRDELMCFINHLCGGAAQGMLAFCQWKAAQKAGNQ